ncbi:POZ domain-containing protein [Ascobolus immersus RN42]|uniref:POZ domain-containing protein n=1 Tax=Ascobolus immersus RN42 TaxID=1160509 RepID=A0A3N4HSF1_ASCIM|nr:POZ domain-containing protein [Ascobolus immersus RN42]
MSDETLNTNNKRPRPENDKDDSSPSKRPAARSVSNNIKEVGRDLFKSQAFSDLVINCNGKEFNVHSLFLRQQSQFFQACLDSGMKEAKENVVNLPDDKPEDIARMLEFLYTGRFWEHEENVRKQNDAASIRIYKAYVDPEEERTQEELMSDPLVVIIRLFQLGNKYGIPGLKKACFLKLRLYAKEMFPLIWNRATPEEMVSEISSQWCRLMDAIEFAFHHMPSPSVFEAANTLLTPLARASPFLLKPEYTSWEDLVNVDRNALLEDMTTKFAGLAEKLEKNSDFATRLFTIICWESLKRRGRENYDWVRVRNFVGSTRRMLNTVSRILDDPVLVSDLPCNRRAMSLGQDTACESPRPMVPALAKRYWDTATPLVFRCRDCDWECAPHNLGLEEENEDDGADDFDDLVGLESDDEE